MVVRVLFVLAVALPFAPDALADGPAPGVLEGGAGVASASGEVRYVTVPAGATTALARIAVRGGEVLQSAVIRGGWGIPLLDYGGTAGGLSRDGRTLVLGQVAGGSCSPAGCSLLRRTTRFQIVDPRTLRPRAVVRLRGDLSFDALSPAGRLLYLIEHTSASDATRYVVRAYDLRRGRLLPRTIADRTQRDWVMQGTPAARAASRDGRFVYTLYTNTGGYPFVHALDAVAARAHCIGIPWTGAETVRRDLDTLKLSGDGRRLTVGAALARRHWYFTVDTGTYRVTALPAVPPGALP